MSCTNRATFPENDDREQLRTIENDRERSWTLLGRSNQKDVNKRKARTDTPGGELESVLALYEGMQFSRVTDVRRSVFTERGHLMNSLKKITEWITVGFVTVVDALRRRGCDGFFTESIFTNAPIVGIEGAFGWSCRPLIVCGGRADLAAASGQEYERGDHSEGPKGEEARRAIGTECTNRAAPSFHGSDLSGSHCFEAVLMCTVPKAWARVP